MGEPSVAVVIPSRNRPGTVGLTVADLLAQTAPPAEIVVVDQSDPPYGEVEGARVVRDEGRGISRGRNAGIDATTADVIAFLDDDMRYEPGFLETLCAPVLDGTAEATCGAIVDPDGGYERERPGWPPSRSWILGLTAGPNHPGSGWTLAFSGGCVAVRRSTIERVGGFDTFFDPAGAGEEREFGLRLFANGVAIRYVGAARARHLPGEVGGRRDPYTDPASRSSRVNALDAHMAYVVLRYFGPTVAEEYVRWWARHAATNHLSWRPRSWLAAVRDARAVRTRYRDVIVPAADAAGSPIADP